MIATHNQHSSDKEHLGLTDDLHVEKKNQNALNVKNLKLAYPLFLSNRSMAHHPKAGLNPLVDATSDLFSLLGELKRMKAYHQHKRLQHELINEITFFQETIQNLAYHHEYVVVCRYILCATFDDVISHTEWGKEKWHEFSLLAAFNQDTNHPDKFFNILERTIKDAPLYIDLMEFIYICLNFGYQGKYRNTEEHLLELEQITNYLYKHIRHCRGSITKVLSPTKVTDKATIVVQRKKMSAIWSIFFITASIIMTIFIGLGLITDIISNEAYQSLTQTSVHHETIK